MILSGKEIQRHMGKDIVIQPFDPKRLARGRAGQAAFLPSARAGPSAKAGWRQVKVLPAFSKAARCGAALHDLDLNRRSRWKSAAYGKLRQQFTAQRLRSR